MGNRPSDAVEIAQIIKVTSYNIITAYYKCSTNVSNVKCIITIIAHSIADVVDNNFVGGGCAFDLCVISNSYKLNFWNN